MRRYIDFSTELDEEDKELLEMALKSTFISDIKRKDRKALHRAIQEALDDTKPIETLYFKDWLSFYDRVETAVYLLRKEQISPDVIVGKIKAPLPFDGLNLNLKIEKNEFLKEGEFYIYKSLPAVYNIEKKFYFNFPPYIVKIERV